MEHNIHSDNQDGDLRCLEPNDDGSPVAERPGESPWAPSESDGPGESPKTLAGSVSAPEGKDFALSHLTATETAPEAFPLMDVHRAPPRVRTIDPDPYVPSLPFEEAGPTSRIWRSYLDESLIDDTNTLGIHRGELNILLVFAGLFSAVVSSYIGQSAVQFQPNYQEMSALLLFDQINIQRALANGTSLDDITTSGTDPTAPFTPDPNTVFINGLWLVSLTLSLMTAFFAILVDAWYCHYLSPIVGEPKVRARTRHFRYKGLIKWRVRASISFLQLLLHFSLIIFFCGLTLSVVTDNITSAVVMFGIFTLSWSFYLISSSIPLFKPECPWKTPLTFLISAISTRTLEPISAVTGTEVKNLSEVDKVQDIEIDAAEESRIENEVDALHWLYERSSTSAIHRLIIQALAGLSPDYIARVEEVFSPYWANIRDEKDRMLMDCMELSRDGSIRWIPRDIPNIDIRIEPLFRLEIMFPALRRKLPSRLFGEHNLDFSRKLSNTLSRTLFVIDDAHIQKPTELKQVLMDALADNGIHHPLVWEKLLDRYVDEDMLFHDLWDVFTIKTCLNLVTGIYLPHHSLPESYSCSLAYASVTYYKQKLLTGLLTFFSTSEPNTDAVGDERRLLLAIVRALAPDAARSIFNSHHAYPLDRDSTIYKYRLLRVALHAINKAINDHAVDNSSKQWRTDTFWAIHSYMTSRLFAERSWRNSEDSEFKDLCWTFHADALACMASLMGERREDWVVEWNADRAKKPTFLNILQFIHDEGVANTPHLPSVGVIPDPLHHADSIIGVVCLLLDQAFSQGIPGAYEAFRETDSLRYIADKCSLRPGLIELLRVYITGASKAATLPIIQSDGFLHWHFQDLHRADVVRCICASIAPSGTERAPILCSLVSINPNHSRWNGIMESLKSPAHENSIINETVEILDDCLQAARRSRNVINQPSTSVNSQNGSPNTRRRSRWPNWRMNSQNGSIDEEAIGLQVRNDQ